MSQATILNRFPEEQMNPDYGYPERFPELREVFDAASGRRFERLQMARGRVFELTWEGRSQSIADQLRQWARQYRNDFFTYQDLERKRYFSGNFDGDLEIVQAGYNSVSLRGRFVEMPGLAMYEYPDNWARDAIFLEERNGLGEDLTKRVGAWGYGEGASSHGGAELQNAGTVTTDSVEILYFGYGFRYYSRKDANLGKLELSLDDVVVNAALDLYGAAASAVVHTQTNVSLGIHRVKARALNTKNAGSSDYKVVFDAIEVMQ
jgi:hypothetical protein